MSEQKARKVRLMLDLDGVYYRWSDTARYIISAHFPNIVLGESTHWDYIKDEVTKQGHPQIWGWLWSEGVTRHGLFRYGSVYKGSREALQAMDESGKVENVIVTSRPGTAMLDTEEYVSFQRIPHVGLHVLRNGEEKAWYVRKDALDIGVDDGEHNIKDLLDNTDAVALLWDRPWNQTFTSRSPRFVRVKSWVDVKAQVYNLYETINEAR